MKTFDQVQRWLQKPGNSKAKLASLLGYKTTVTITAWELKRRVPANREAQVLSIIKEGK